MDLKEQFIKDIGEYKIFNELINECVYVDNKLPNQVFKPNYTQYLFNDFDLILASEYWNEIKRLAYNTGDSMIILAVIDPNPIDYYYHHFKYINWLKLSTNLTSEDYIELLQQYPVDNEADSIFFNSNILVIAPLSKKWVIWIDRYYEICIVAFADKGIYDLMTTKPNNWKNVDEALDLWLSAYIRNIERFNNDRKEFLKNYKSLKY